MLSRSSRYLMNIFFWVADYNSVFDRLFRQKIDDGAVVSSHYKIELKAGYGVTSQFKVGLCKPLVS
jgi:hypothetical protein